MKERYLLIHKEKGVFLGTHSNYLLFASNAGFDIVKAYSFASKRHANEFIDQLESLNPDDLFTAEIESKDKYIHVVDIIKAGYGQYIFEMVDNMQMISENIH